MKRILLLLVAIATLASCTEQEHKVVSEVRYYKVKDIESNTSSIVKSFEPKDSHTWVYNQGDTVLVNTVLGCIRPSQNATKCIIIQYL